MNLKTKVTPEIVSKYLKVVGYRLLIKPDPIKTTTDSGIIFQADYERSLEMAKANIGTGTVVSIGPMAWKGIKGYDHTIGGNWCEVGDHIIYSKYSGKPVFDPVQEDKEEKKPSSNAKVSQNPAPNEG